MDKISISANKGNEEKKKKKNTSTLQRIYRVWRRQEDEQTLDPMTAESVKNKWTQ